ncbi:MBL fold metallo-hydrolase [Streptomyces sp. TRM43335]|uniref:MBL fold metallo-hydrolase n=1 Tax=Streptomyces taklimakanensis TaxID=2569853 RepID=A0A6G2BFW6_9ACTN|nr:MBL fold metallo-hydrolase [Streptomyces taklimakanensis]MTE21016.1 MBL fold metallo-hydrolase [Streptomyces taklimakanensis]
MAGRRTLLKGALVVAGTTVSGLGLTGAVPSTRREEAYSTPVRLRWLGVSGWEIVIGEHRSLLFDPYLSRMPYTDADGALDPGLPLRPDPRAVDRIVSRHLSGTPELVMVSHGHFDHLADVPHLLGHRAWQDARVRTMCDETSGHLLAAMGTPRARLDDVIRIKGGEYLQFDGYTVEVLRSLHSMGDDYGYFAPGRRTTPPKPPATLGDLVEGETFAYQVSVAGGPRILLMGATNFIEREMAGIRPDVATIPMTSHSALHRYPARLLETLGHPPLVLPCHHDDMITSLLEDPAVLASSVSEEAVDALASAASSASRVLGPRHLEAVDVTAALP